MFLKCKYLENFWKNIQELFQKLKIGCHILTLKNLILGYKIEDKQYNDINYFLTIIFFTIYKCYYMSEQKKKKVNIYSIFKYEFRKRFEIIEIRKTKTSYFLKKVAKLI